MSFYFYTLHSHPPLNAIIPNMKNSLAHLPHLKAGELERCVSPVSNAAAKSRTQRSACGQIQACQSLRQCRSGRLEQTTGCCETKGGPDGLLSEAYSTTRRIRKKNYYRILKMILIYQKTKQSCLRKKQQK